MHRYIRRSAKFPLSRFKMVSDRFIMLVFVVSSLCFSFACHKKKAESCDDKNTSLYKSADFRVGVSVDVGLLESNAAYRNIVISQFNVIVPDKAYLLSRIHPRENYYDFSEFDDLSVFCRQYQKHLEGANLFYQLYLPDWIENFDGDRLDWENLAKSHIQTIVSRYKGVVESWMVVNEALNEDGTLSDNIWRRHIGDHYIEKFYQWAHEADPDALLFYNDYNLESNRQKLLAALDLVSELRLKGLRVDGIGMQMHSQVSFPSPGEVVAASTEIVNKGFIVYYSEWDISFNLLNNKTVLTEEMKLQQKHLIYDIVRNYRQVPEKYRRGITFWNVGDADSWIRPQFNRIDWPLMWDDNYNPKPAYCGFIDALN